MRQKRLNNIIALLRSRNRMFIKDLESLFDVSPITLRQDLQYLEKQGFVSRSYGEVAYMGESYLIGNSSLAEFRSLDAKRRQFNEEKRRIAAAAARFVHPNSTVFLDESTTVSHLLPFIKVIEGLTVYTNGLTVMNELSDSPSLRVYAIGGKFSPAHQAYLGKRFLDQLQAYDFDVCFVGGCGINTEFGSTESSLAIVEMKQGVSARSEKTVLLVDHSKIGVNKIIPCLSWQALNALVTDAPLPEHFSSVLAKNHVECFVADPIGSAGSAGLK